MLTLLRLTRLRSCLTSGFAIAAFAVCAPLASTQAKQPPSNPIGAGWETQSKPTTNSTGQSFDARQMATIAKVNTYFNALKTLQGRFVQTDADGKVSKGKIYISRPGRFRFEYARPSRKIIISDGRFLAIQDLDLRNEDTYELDNTPFRILLRDDVNLIRDAKIHHLAESNGTIVMALSDKSPDAVGSITVTLKTESDGPVLTGWVTTDAQGLKTVVTISDLTYPEKLDDKLFVREKLFMKNIGQN